MKCPVCPDSTLQMSERRGIEIDYCPQCRGVWLDRGELDKLIAADTPAHTAPQAPQPMQHSYRPDHDDERHHGYRPQYGHHGKRRKDSLLGELFDF